MQLRNLLNAGDFVTPIPVGIPITLQYKDTGNLESLYLGHITDFDSISTAPKLPEVYSACVKNASIPTHLPTNHGTAWVYAVVYSGKWYENQGLLPGCFVESMLSDLVKDSNFNVFAAFVIATSINFVGVAQIRTWLQGNDFKLLPGCLLPPGDCELNLRKFMKTTQFNYEEISELFSVRGCDLDIIDLDIEQHRIKSLDIFTDQYGHLRVEVQFESFNINISYLQYLNLHIHEGDNVLVNHEHVNILCKYPLPQQTSVSNKYTCSFCNRVFEVTDDFTKCPNEHCASRMYPDLLHFLRKLNLLEISYDEYLDFLNSGKLQTFGDILLHENYKDVTITASLHTLLDAIIPITAVRNRQTIWNLCSSCNNSYETLHYYMTHPTLIHSDLGIECKELERWFEDRYNIKTVEEILMYSNVMIGMPEKKFEGSPIFRNTKIYLTGKFMHGSYSELTSILASYNGEVTSDPKEASMGVIGDIPEDIDGHSINVLRSNNLPVYTESQFFSKYEIDEDLVYPGPCIFF